MAATQPTARTRKSKATSVDTGTATTGTDKSVPEVVSELWSLAVDYAKQETIDPLKGLGRYLGFGIAAAATIGIGMVLLAVGALRALQTETGSTFTGNLSWAPYAIVLAGSIIVLGVVGAIITKGTKQ